MAYHLSPLEDKTALTFARYWFISGKKNMPGMIQCPDTLCCCCYRLRPGTFHAHRAGALFLYFCFALTLSVIDFRLSSCPTNSPYRCSGLAWYLIAVWIN